VRKPYHSAEVIRAIKDLAGTTRHRLKGDGHQ
jgi:hypothetical protein